jgi:tetratricopeptide (TPR) repeat protein
MQTTVRTTLSVVIVLICAFIATGFINSAYERERAKLADRHFRSGQALLRVNDLGGAADEFRKALLFAPDNSDYRLSLASALVDAGKLDEAQSHLEQLAQDDPTNGRINLLLARVAERQHHTKLAMESYQRAVYEYWPPNELNRRREARWELISLLNQTGQNRDQLVGELLQLYANLPPHSDQRIRVGNLLLNAGADAEAAHVFHDILKDVATLPEAQVAAISASAHGGLAQIAFRSGDYIEARHEYQRVLRSAPDDLATAAALQLTNEIIDIAPQLPNISAAERLRRSQNLYNRVTHDIDQCANPDIATKPMTEPQLPAKDDMAAQLQQAAEDLWKSRNTFCPNQAVKDPAVEAVLSRLGNQSQ